MKDIEEITTNDFFFCYDEALSTYLKSEGFRYFQKARSIKDNKIYTMYLHSKELHFAIKEWNKKQ
ncbi:hypothetical protein M3649_04240 [Ureibacillus chungkukjangi]|nr:hypothetical protein [Ureibacillus chungkukjangi]